jgi:hypothetical protein
LNGYSLKDRESLGGKDINWVRVRSGIVVLATPVGCCGKTPVTFVLVMTIPVILE